MTTEQINEQLAERKKIIDQMRAMNDAAIQAKKGFDSEQQAKYDQMHTDEKAIKAAVDRAFQINESETSNRNQPEGVRGVLNDEGKPKGPRASAEYLSAFTALLKDGEGSLPTNIKATLQKATGPQGGYLVPIEFETEIVKKMYNANLMRQLGTVMRTTSQVNIPMEGSLPSFAWIDEVGTYPQTDGTAGQNILGAWKLGGIIKASEELLDDAFTDVPAYIARLSGIAAGFAEEGAYIAGDGVKKPTGWQTTVLASGTTVVSAAPAVVSTADIFKLYYGLSRAYRQNASFVFADTAMLSLRSEKATTGQYIWQPGLSAGAPDTLLGKPVYTSDFMAAVAATAVSGAFGDFSYYQIVDRIGWSMQRLNELYAETGLVGFKMHERTDGKLLRPEAVVTLTQHA